MPLIALAEAPQHVQLFVKARYAEDFATRLVDKAPEAIVRLRVGGEPFATALTRWRFDTDTNEVVTSSNSRWPVPRDATATARDARETLTRYAVDETHTVPDDAPSRVPLPPIRPERP